MEEKNLLKEITFLSRLIGQHKNELKSHNIAPSYLPQKIVNRNLRAAPYKVPVQNLKATISRYSKINHRLPQSTPKQYAGSTESSVYKAEHKIQVKKSATPISVLVSLDKTKAVKLCEDSFSEAFEKKIAGGSSVHINPNFFTKAKNNPQEIATLRCKSVHINPRLLDTVANSAISGGHENEILPDCPVVLPKNFPVACTQNEGSQCAVSSEATNVCKPKPQCTVVSSPVSAEKSTNLSVPLRTPTTRKKYIYHSKTKLVKAVGSTPSSDCKLIRKTVTPVSLQSTAKTIKTPHGGTLLAVSRTKLVRLSGKTRRPSSSKSESGNTSQTIAKSRYCLRRSSASTQSSPLVRTARRVTSKSRSAALVTVLGATSKYHLDHRLNKTLRKGRSGSCRSQYKVDHRSPLLTSSARLTRAQSHLLISPLRRSSFSNRTWTSTATPRVVQKVAISHKKLSRIGCNPGSRNYLQNSTLVRIGGLLYKSSRTKLILSGSSEKKTDTALKPHTIVKRRSLNAGHIVYVRGNKFVMDQCGKTLKRVTDSDVSTPQSRDRRKSRVSRVDIGGVTYIQKTPSVLVRTNTHTARNVLSTAKQRSIAFLAQKMRKINTPCLFYRRFGRCPRQEKGRCELVHDPKYIDICKKFLQGKCTLDGCLLSHDVGPEKMPTCRFFLEGCCVRDLCPYLHVKVNDRAPICCNFLQGYCADGPECLKRHIMLCPQFDKKGSCAKGKYCPYPHSTVPRVQRAICSDPPITFSERKEEQSNSPIPLKRKRYYETESDEPSEDQCSSPTPLKMKRYYETEMVCEDSQDTQSDVDTSETDIEQSMSERSDNIAIRRRPKIGDLPSFIALESFESD